MDLLGGGGCFIMLALWGGSHGDKRRISPALNLSYFCFAGINLHGLSHTERKRHNSYPPHIMRIYFLYGCIVTGIWKNKGWDGEKSWGHLENRSKRSTSWVEFWNRIWINLVNSQSLLIMLKCLWYWYWLQLDCFDAVKLHQSGLQEKIDYSFKSM